MPFELILAGALRAGGWKVKIRDGERLEVPHVTIIWGVRSWRVSLRDGRFLDRHPSPRGLPRTVLATVFAEFDVLRRAWDGMYPDNPVGDAR